MIVVFGSINMDMVIQGDRLPRPGETITRAKYALIPGGKGANQACAAAHAGASVTMVGMVGADDWGRAALVGLAAAGVDLSRVGRCDTPTGAASVCVDKQGENAILVASGANMEARAAHVPDALLRAGNTLLLQMEVPLEESALLIEKAHRNGMRVILNTAPFAPLPDAVLTKVDVLVCNEIEAAMLAGSEDAAVMDLAADLAMRHDLACIVTLGERGLVGRSPDAGWQIDALAIDCLDTTGAGDAFCGVLAAGLDQGLTMPEALRRAIVGAGLSCQSAGAQSAPVSRAAIDAQMKSAPPVHAIQA